MKPVAYRVLFSALAGVLSFTAQAQLPLNPYLPAPTQKPSAPVNNEPRTPRPKRPKKKKKAPRAKAQASADVPAPAPPPPPPAKKKAKATRNASNSSVKLLKKSSAKDMFIFKQESGSALSSGDSLIISSGGRSVAELEVVRSEASKRLFLARAKKYYGSASELRSGQSFSAAKAGAPTASDTGEEAAATAPDTDSREAARASRVAKRRAEPQPAPSPQENSSTPEMAYDEIDAGEPANRAPESPKRFFIYTGLGVSKWNYSEASFGQAALPSYSLTGVDGSLLVRFIISSRFYLNADGTVTLFAIDDNAADTTGRFYAAQGQLGYVAVNGKSTIFQIIAGWYYRTVTSSGAVFGVANLMGPQLYPRVVFRLNPKNSLAVYARYSPLWDGFKPQALSNREIGAGIEWFRQVSQTNNISLRLDISSIHLKHKLAEIGTIDGTNFGLTTGYYW